MLVLADVDDGSRDWWLYQQAMLQRMGACVFAKELVCLTACPVDDFDVVKHQLREMTYRIEAMDMPVVPRGAEEIYWHKHDCMIAAGVALQFSPARKVFQPTAPAVGILWGHHHDHHGRWARNKM